MQKKGIHIFRQFLLVVLALQILNLSVGSQEAWDSDYDYSYTYNKTYDPTESAVEWIVELNYGQQPGFSYSIHEAAGKSPTKSFHWKTDLYKPLTTPAILPLVKQSHPELSGLRIPSPAQETFSPPPEWFFA
jgi:hypothetical protein